MAAPPRRSTHLGGLNVPSRIPMKPGKCLQCRHQGPLLPTLRPSGKGSLPGTLTDDSGGVHCRCKPPEVAQAAACPGAEISCVLAAAEDRNPPTTGTLYQAGTIPSAETPLPVHSRRTHQHAPRTLLQPLDKFLSAVPWGEVGHCTRRRTRRSWTVTHRRCRWAGYGCCAWPPSNP